MNNNQNINNATDPNVIPNPLPLVNNIPVNNGTNMAGNGPVVNNSVGPAPQPQPVNSVPTQPVNAEPTQGISVTEEQLNANEHINNMNVDGAYNHMDAPPSYVNDQDVTENVRLVTGQKKVTVPVSKELKTVFLIALVLLAFIFILPMLGDWLTNLRFR